MFSGKNDLEGYQLPRTTDVEVLIQAIRTERQRQGMSQRELGVRAGVGQSFIAAIETHPTRSFYLSTIIRVVNALGGEVTLRFRRPIEEPEGSAYTPTPKG